MTAEARAAVLRNAFASAALEAGYDVYLPVCTAGADLVIAREQDGVLRPIVLRQAWSAADMVEGRERWIAFVAGGRWHVASDDLLLGIIGRPVDRPDGLAGSIDFADLDADTVTALDDHVLRAHESWPPLDLPLDRPRPWNVALVACLQPLVEPRNFADPIESGAEGVEDAISAFIHVCATNGWITVGYDQKAARIASAPDDGWLRLSKADVRRLDSVLCYVNSGEKFAGGWYSEAARKGLLRSIAMRAGMLAAEARTLSEPVLAERVTGSLLGAAIGDALGLPVEGLRTTDIRRRFGPRGVAGYVEAFGRTGSLSGEAQTMLCVAAGLAAEVVAEDGEAEPLDQSMVLSDEAVEVERARRACLEWLSGQAGRTDGMSECAVTLHPFLRERRPHGRTTAKALAAGDRLAVNDSKGNGCLLRVIPVGLAHLTTMPDEVYRRASKVAALTHGHPVARAAAGVFATLLSRLACRQRLPEAVACALGMAPNDEVGEEVRSLVLKARQLVDGRPPSAEALEMIGGGFVAAEALAIAIHCVMCTSDFEGAVLAAVNHSGDSDATGAIAGAIAGALYGTNAIPLDLLKDVEGREAINGIAAGLLACTGLEPWTEGCIGENVYEEMSTPEDEARAAEAAVREAVEEGKDVEAAIASFSSGHPEVAARVRRWARRRRKPSASGQGALLSG